MNQIKLQNAWCWQSWTMHKSVRAHVLHVFRAQVVSAFDLKMGAKKCSKMLQKFTESYPSSCPHGHHRHLHLHSGQILHSFQCFHCSNLRMLLRCSAPSKIDPPESLVWGRSRSSMDKGLEKIQSWALMSTRCSIKRNISWWRTLYDS